MISCAAFTILSGTKTLRDSFAFAKNKSNVNEIPNKTSLYSKIDDSLARHVDSRLDTSIRPLI